MVYTVPDGTATKAYRIVFRDYDLLDATFTVKLAIKSAVVACDPDNEPWNDYKGTPDELPGHPLHLLVGHEVVPERLRLRLRRPRSLRSWR